MTQTQERHWYLDLLRIAATLLIVAVHALPYGLAAEPFASARFSLVTAMSIFCRWGVPVFYMISGALFLSPEKQIETRRLYTKTIPRMAASFLFWSALYAFTYCLTYDKGKWTFLNQLLRGHYHMWFIFSITGLYILTPLLRKITVSKSAAQYFLITAFLLTFVARRALVLLTALNLPHADIIASLNSALLQTDPFDEICPVFYFVLGHYLHTCPPTRLRIAAPAAAIVGFLMTLCLTLWHSALTGTPSYRFAGSDSLGICLISAGVFACAKLAFAGFAPGKKSRRALMTLSKCSFGIYLAHAFFLEAIPVQYTPQTAFVPGLMTSFAIIGGTFFLSFAVSWLLGRIPVLRDTVV